MTITGRSAKILVAALAVSVVLNFVAIGFAGAVVGGGFLFRGVVGEAMSAYPQSLRTAFRQNVTAHRGEVVAALRDLRAARVDQQAILTAEAFDRAAAEAGQARVRERGVEVVALLQTILLDSIAELPDADRRAIPRTPAFGLQGLSLLDGSEAEAQ